MADETVQIDFEAEDKVSPKLSKMERGISRLGTRVDQASARFKGLLGQTAMVAGFFSLGPAIAGAKRYIDHLDKISNLTGMSADRIGGISNALQGAGVSAEGVEATFANIAKKSTLAAEGNKALIKLGKTYGSTLKDGPEAALIGMSAQLESGTLNATQLQRVIGLSAKDAGDLAEALKAGPEELAAQFDTLTEKNKAFGEGGAASLGDFEDAVGRIGQSFNRMTAGIVVKLAPAMTKLAAKFESSIDGWADKAERFGNFLVEHMDSLIASAKVYAKIMFANIALQKLTGQGIGGNILRVNRGVGAIGGLLGGKKAGAAASGSAGQVGGVLSSFFSGALKLRPLLSSFARIGVAGGVIFLAIEAFKRLPAILETLNARFGKVLGQIWGNISQIGSTIAGLFSEDSALGKGVRWLGDALLDVIGSILNAVNFLASEASIRLEQIAGWKTREDVLSERSVKQFRRFYEPLKAQKGAFESLLAAKGTPTAAQRTQAKAIIDAYSTGVMGHAGVAGYAAKAGMTPEKIAELKRRFGGATKAGGQAVPSNNVYQDFRGSRFDIKQAFAEGYDPDRIAVAFSQDVAALGEKRLQSGFAPLFTVAR